MQWLCWCGTPELLITDLGKTKLAFLNTVDSRWVWQHNLWLTITYRIFLNIFPKPRLFTALKNIRYKWFLYDSSSVLLNIFISLLPSFYLLIFCPYLTFVLSSFYGLPLFLCSRISSSVAQGTICVPGNELVSSLYKANALLAVLALHFLSCLLFLCS